MRLLGGILTKDDRKENQMLTWIETDISCKQFDAAWYTETGRKHIKPDNNDEGFAKLLEEAPEEE